MGLIGTEEAMITLQSALSRLWLSEIREAAIKAIYRLGWLDEREAEQNALNAALAAIRRRLGLEEETEGAQVAEESEEERTP